DGAEGGDDGYLALAFVHEGQVDHAQVKVAGDDAGDHADDGQPEQVGFDGGAEEEEFAGETAGGWHAGEGEHEEGQGQGQSRAAGSKAFVVVQVQAAIATLNGDDNGKGADVGEEIGQHVVETGGDGA